MKKVISNKKNVKIMTYAGAIPFAVALVVAASFRNNIFIVRTAQHISLEYGKIILSFIAGSRWGLALTTQNKISYKVLIFSNILALYVWCSAILRTRYNFLLLAIGFVAAIYPDMVMCKNSIIPLWYRNLRYQVTAIVFAAILATSML